MGKEKKVILLAGPTSSGKSKLAIKLAHYYNGEIINGSNQENVAYPSGLCAERVALFYAGARFPDVKIKTIAVSVMSKNFKVTDVISPCGACRQVMAEYEDKQEQAIKVILHSPTNQVLIANTVESLLPFMFKSPLLKQH